MHLDYLEQAGFEVVGLDGSEAMLALAARNAPKAELVCEDARRFSFDRPFDAGP